MQSVSSLLGQPMKPNDDHGDVKIEVARPNRWGSAGHWEYHPYGIDDEVMQSVSSLLGQPMKPNDAHGD